MTIVRWTPFGEMTNLTHSLNRLFSDSAMGQDWESAASRRQIAVNLKETEKAFEVQTMLPGVDPSEVEIHISNGILTIKGETKKENDGEEGDYICRECYEGSFYRQISLPSHVLGDQAEASAHNGILTISIPKAPETQPRKIEVKTRDESGSEIEAKQVKTVSAKTASKVKAKNTTKK
ncbi:hypothetical protein AUK40_06820 [Candidatus Wirthbacteria bacterium CG2_30_54_11]|uniref:SHSP domain-containing protein n=1 Tax=Candidatus Wirthbacteria bacterium CG2_30_54_11 TaxID=1817892 RepID=A0A1J5IQE6_9BACT|nr:MAG: hypothetical protein AUK40_06820 [Candidatus Wirthbacteria bacterium CG2_30_54_11]